MTVEIRRGSARFVERTAGRQTWHAFSFGSAYDPERLAFGPMVCHDEHLMRGGVGFETHRHSGLDIVTYVVSGALEHTDDTGTTVVPAGAAAVLVTGSGVEHQEIAATGAGPCRFVQVWLRGDQPDAAPSYRVIEPAELERPVAVGAAGLQVVVLAEGAAVDLPDAGRVHLFVASGALLRSSLAEPLQAGDALLVSPGPRVDPDQPGLAAAPVTGPLSVMAAVPSTLLVWTLPG